MRNTPTQTKRTLLNDNDRFVDPPLYTDTGILYREEEFHTPRRTLRSYSPGYSLCSDKILKEKEPEKFDGRSMDWQDYVISF